MKGIGVKLFLNAAHVIIDLLIQLNHIKSGHIFLIGFNIIITEDTWMNIRESYYTSVIQIAVIYRNK